MPENQIKLIADIAILLNDKVLLVRYKDSNKYDHHKGWFLPDDEINHGEHPDNAAERILSEQLGIKSPVIALHHIESFTGNDKSWHLVFHYVMHINALGEFAKSEDLDEGQWFKINEIPDDKDIAHHGWAKYTIEEIINKK